MFCETGDFTLHFSCQPSPSPASFSYVSIRLFPINKQILLFIVSHLSAVQFPESPPLCFPELHHGHTRLGV
jgi:hypothetical protein